jgi:hypothetical protein
MRVLGCSLLIAAVVTSASLTVAPAAAGEPRPLGTFKDWDAFVMEDGGGIACYMASRPKKTTGDVGQRGESHLLITHRPAERSFDVVSFTAGYNFAPRSEAVVEVGTRSFKLFTEKDAAWAREEATDHALAQAIRGASSLVLRGTSARGGRSVDTYSLAGSSAAYQAINKACGVAG